jgi:hypothetical protein
MGSTFPSYTSSRRLLPILQYLSGRRTLRSSNRRPKCLQISALLSSLRCGNRNFGRRSGLLVGLGCDFAEDWWVYLGEGEYCYGGWVDEECVFEGCEVIRNGQM